MQAFKEYCITYNLRNVGSNTYIPECAGHISARGHYLIIIDKTATRKVPEKLRINDWKTKDKRLKKNSIFLKQFFNENIRGVYRILVRGGQYFQHFPQKFRFFKMDFFVCIICLLVNLPSVSWQFSWNPHVPLPRLQAVYTTHIIQATTSYIRTRRSVRTSHDPWTTQRYGVNLKIIKK